MPTVAEPVDRDHIAGKVNRLVDNFRRGEITEYVLLVSLRILLRDRDEANYQLSVIKERT